VGMGEICPPDHHGDDEPGNGGGHRFRRPFRLGHAPRHGDDRLAEDDDREEAVALGDVTDIERSLDRGAHGHPWGHQIDRQRGDPHPWLDLLRQRERHEPDHRRETKTRRVADGERMAPRVEPGRAQKEADDDGVEGDEGQDQSARVAMARRLDLGRHGQHGQHGRKCAEAIECSPFGEAGGVPGVLHPGPPDRDEECCEERDALDGGFVVQGVRDGADGDDEAEIEEELKPRGSPLRDGRGPW
jgi:hypothetical protein